MSLAFRRALPQASRVLRRWACLAGMIILYSMGDSWDNLYHRIQAVLIPCCDGTLHWQWTSTTVCPRIRWKSSSWKGRIMHRVDWHKLTPLIYLTPLTLLIIINLFIWITLFFFLGSPRSAWECGGDPLCDWRQGGFHRKSYDPSVCKWSQELLV